MKRSISALGIVGAVLILLGAGIAGAGFFVSAVAQQNEFNCAYQHPLSNCGQSDEADENDSVLAEFLISGGVVAGGVGLFLVVYAMVILMAQRREQPPRAREVAEERPPSPPPPPAVETPPEPSGPPSSWTRPPTWDSRSR
jgi:hypothetical protein